MSRFAWKSKPPLTGHKSPFHCEWAFSFPSSSPLRYTSRTRLFSCRGVSSMRVHLLVAVLASVALCAASASAQDMKPEVRAKLEGHRGGVTALAFPSSGEMIATGSGNGIVRLWDTKTGETLVKLDRVGGTRVVHVGFSADGKLLSAAARKSVVAWSLSEPNKPREVFEYSYGGESPSRVGGVSGDGKRVYFFSPKDGEL